MVHQFVVFQLQISKKDITTVLIGTMHYKIAYPFWTHNLVPLDGQVQTGPTYRKKHNGTLTSKDLLLMTLNMHKEEYNMHYNRSWSQPLCIPLIFKWIRPIQL